MALNFPISITSAYLFPDEPEVMVDRFIQHGFHSTELSIEHLRMMVERSESTGVSLEKVGRDFRSYIESKNFSVPQAHLTFRRLLCDEGTVDVMKEELVLLDAMGVKNTVVHFNGGDDLEQEARLALKYSRLQELVDFVKGSEISLCLENLFSNPDVVSAEQLLEIISNCGGKNLGICLDTGHLHVANARGMVSQSQGEFIRKAGSYLKALHIANNDTSRDQHLMPFCHMRRGVDFADVMKGLGDIEYKGLFNLEIPGEQSKTMPTVVQEAKLKYLKVIVEYMMTDEFLRYEFPRL